MKIIVDAVYEAVDKSAPSAREIGSPAEGRGFQSGVSQPRSGVRLRDEILRHSRPETLCSSDPTASRPALYSYGPLGLFLFACLLLPYLARTEARDSGFETNFGQEYLKDIPPRRYSMFDGIREAPGVSPTSPSSGTVPAAPCSA